MSKTTVSGLPMDLVNLRVNCHDWHRSHYTHKLARLYGVSGTAYIHAGYIIRVGSKQNPNAVLDGLVQSCSESFDFSVSGLAFSEALDFIKNPSSLLGARNRFRCLVLARENGTSHSGVRCLLASAKKAIRATPGGPHSITREV